MRRRPLDFLRSVLPSGGRRSRATRPIEPEDTREAVSLLDEPSMGDCELDELREFMTCERLSRRADPAFRERLRLDLWWGLVVHRAGGPARLPRA